MYQYIVDVSKLKRASRFPCRLWKVFFCEELCHTLNQKPVRNNCFEVCFRLESEGGICRDIINGSPIHATYPHAVWKMPGLETAARDNSARKVLSLLYPAEQIRSFVEMDLIPLKDCVVFSMNDTIRQMTEKLVGLLNDLYAPGAADQLDWLGFSLIKEVLLAGKKAQAGQTMEQKMREIAGWLKVHCSENPDFHALARQHELSYTQFYREWSKYLDVTPRQFIIQSRLEAAAELLKLTRMPIWRIVEQVNFSNSFMFFRRFEEKYGMTPALYRAVMRPRDRRMHTFRPAAEPLAKAKGGVYSKRKGKKG